jgi:hypothetical protein
MKSVMTETKFETRIDALIELEYEAIGGDKPLKESSMRVGEPVKVRVHASPTDTTNTSNRR